MTPPEKAAAEEYRQAVAEYASAQAVLRRLKTEQQQALRAVDRAIDRLEAAQVNYSRLRQERP